MSLFGFARHIAVFYDENGDFVGKHTIGYTTTSRIGHKKHTFKYGKRTYNINPLVSRAKTRGFTVFCDDYVYSYDIDNPDPITYKRENVKPLMNPEQYQDRLESKLIEQLHAAGLSGLAGFFTMKNIIILLLIAGAAYYFLSGGQILPSGEGG